MRKETPDILLDCFDAVSKKISGMHIEIGADDSVWLLPDGKNMPGAIMWSSREAFLTGNRRGEIPVFTIARLRGDVFAETGWSEFLSANRWMAQMSSCSSPEEIAVKLACIGQ